MLNILRIEQEEFDNDYELLQKDRKKTQKSVTLKKRVKNVIKVAAILPDEADDL